MYINYIYMEGGINQSESNGTKKLAPIISPSKILRLKAGIVFEEFLWLKVRLRRGRID